MSIVEQTFAENVTTVFVNVTKTRTGYLNNGFKPIFLNLLTQEDTPDAAAEDPATAAVGMIVALIPPASADVPIMT